MKTTHRKHTVWGVAALILIIGTTSWAELARVGPIDDTSFGYPRWYQDTTGVIFELGIPLSQAEIDGGWVFVEDSVFPETFPDNFSVEHFWWTAEASIDFGDDFALLVLALESTFSVDEVVEGDQISFGRLRIRIRDLPFSGDYTVFTPYGNFTFENHCRERWVTATWNRAGRFYVGLFYRMFPLPSVTPGGAEHPHRI